jgi:CTP:molybdopterin cytidylyltransferase MocA
MANKQNRTYEAPDMAAMMARTARALVRRAAEGDLEALSALADSERVMRESLDAAVAALREREDQFGKVTPWSAIAGELGVSRQAAQMRWGK